jgi:peptide/nickel transport system permease protein
VIQPEEGGTRGAVAGPVSKVLARLPAAHRVLGRLRGVELAVALFIIVLFAALIVLVPLLGLPDPIHQHLENRLLPPGTDHLFGTDQLGRDVFSRVLFGGRTSLPAAIAVVAIGFTVGTLVGAVAGFLGGAVDQVLSRVTDMFFAFPVLVLAMAVAAALGASLVNGVVALAVVWWMSYMRVSRGMVLDLKNRDYVVASRAAGRRRSGILARVIMPNVLPALLVMAALDVGRAVLMFAMLSFLGLGAKPPEPEWGSMVANGATVMEQWWVSTFPGLAILVLVFAFNLLGDSIRDALDPWVRGRR